MPGYFGEIAVEQEASISDLGIRSAFISFLLFYILSANLSTYAC